MMGYFGVDAPLCSYVYITVNGEDWGLYLAVEGVEESFLERNYGSGYGELYKPDSMSMGGGRGNGGAFDMEDWMDDRGDEASQDTNTDRQAMKGQRPGGMSPPGMDDGAMPELPEEGAFGERPEGIPEGGEIPEGFGENGGRGGGMMGSDDVSLIYTDDNYDSYHEQLHGRRYGRSHGAGRSGQPVRRAGDTVTACAIPGEDTAPAVSAAAANTAGWRPAGGRNASDAA